MATPVKIATVIVITDRFSDSFMKEDLRLLQQFTYVLPFETDSWQPHRRGRFWGRVRQVRNLFKLLSTFLRFDVQVLVFWFAHMYETPVLAALGKLFGKKIVVITGGGDAAYVPEIDWGNWKFPAYRAGFALLMQLTDSVLPFSNSAKAGIVQDYAPKRIRTIYPSIDTNFFTPALERIQQRVVTCCYQYDELTIIQKGLDQFVEVARQLSEIEFVLIGNAVTPEALAFQQRAPANVTFMARIPTRAGYRDFLQASSVYAQLSVHEGFGVSLAEAMACGALPVVTNRYSLPEVVGDCGWIVPYGPDTVAAATQAIQCALAADNDRREAARNRVVSLFNQQSRSRALYEELARLRPDLPQIRVELGCGSTGIPGTIGVDMRMTRQTQAVCDVRHSCFANECADEVYSFCVLEHLDNPYELMDEVVRVLKPNGRAFLRVPNIGTYSAHLDTTHRFLADLSIWKSIMQGYFEEVAVMPAGLKYRDNRLLTAINRFLVYGLHFYELTQGWTFVCDKKRAKPVYGYVGWWQESDLK